MTDITISNAQHRVLEDAANFPENSIEKFMSHLPAGAQKSMIEALVKKGCIETRGNEHYLTATGLTAVGRDATPCNTPQRETKQSMIMTLLSREEGATLQQIMAATEWKSHSVRGHLSNLRKKWKLPIEIYVNRDGIRGYRIHSIQAE